MLSWATLGPGRACFSVPRGTLPCRSHSRRGRGGFGRYQPQEPPGQKKSLNLFRISAFCVNSQDVENLFFLASFQKEGNCFV